MHQPYLKLREGISIPAREDLSAMGRDDGGKKGKMHFVVGTLPRDLFTSLYEPKLPQSN